MYTQRSLNVMPIASCQKKLATGAIVAHDISDLVPHRLFTAFVSNFRDNWKPPQGWKVSVKVKSLHCTINIVFDNSCENTDTAEYVSSELFHKMTKSRYAQTSPPKQIEAVEKTLSKHNRTECAEIVKEDADYLQIFVKKLGEPLTPWADRVCQTSTAKCLVQLRLSDYLPIHSVLYSAETRSSVLKDE